MNEWIEVPTGFVLRSLLAHATDAPPVAANGDWIELPAVFVLRALQAAALCLPTLLCGMLVAGVLRTFVGGEWVRRWFAAGSSGDLLRALAIAWFLPVCAFGVLPVLAVLRSMRVRWAPLTVIALAAPLVTPWTLGYLLDRCGVIPLLLLLTANGAIALAAGFVVDRLSPDAPPERIESDDLPTSSLLLNTLWASGRSLNRGVLTILALGLFGVGSLAVLIPPNAVGDWLVERSIPHAVVLGVVPLFTYVTPETASMQAGEIVRSSTMPGLLVPLIATGTAIHLGLLVAACRAIGLMKGLCLLGIVLILTLATGAIVDAALHDPTYFPEDTHAFEDYGRPFHLLDHSDGPIAGFVHRFTRPLSANLLPAGAAVAILVIGARLRRTYSADAKPPRQYLSDRQTRIAMAVWVIATGVLTVFTYYPPPSALDKELRATSAEFNVAYQRGEHAEAWRLSRRIDHRLAQLPVSALLHGSPLNPEKRELSKTLRQRLDDLTRGMRGNPPNREASLAFQTVLGDLLRAPR